MANGNKFWLDRFLYEIPLLTCDHEKLDYPAIMSQFHYLLLKKDMKTYEEFMKYWAILIITAPDAFDEDETKHFKNLVFSKVKDSAIKLNRPMEKIELPPGQPKLVEASNFRYENWKPILDETYSRADMDDVKVYKWYTDPANTLAARSFFGVYCMTLLGAYTIGRSTLVGLLKIIQLFFARNQKSDIGKECTTFTANKRISFSQGTATFINNAFRSQIGTYRKVLRIVLDWNEYHIDHDASCDLKRKYFFERQVKASLIYNGLSIMKFAITYQVNIETWLELKSACGETGSEKLLLALAAFDAVQEHIDGVRRQDRTYLEQKPQFVGENCRFWPYSRLFSSQYFETLGDGNNLEFLAFCLGYKNLSRTIYIYYYNRYLANANYALISETDEEIERGWNKGQAIFISQEKTPPN